jgi:hypothetical protein
MHCYLRLLIKKYVLGLKIKMKRIGEDMKFDMAYALFSNIINTKL